MALLGVQTPPPPSGTDAPSDGRISLLLLGGEASYRVLIQCVFLLN
jgi:hypothetical protein